MEDIRKITINGSEISYIEKGEGNPVVFVHGSLGDYRSWGFQMESFSKFFRVIAYSRRYHYPNKWTGTGSDYSIALHANDLSEFISTLGIAPAHLVGSSYGAYVSLYLTSKEPSIVRSLVLGEPPILPWLNDIEGGQILQKEFLTNSFGPAREAFQNGRMEEGVNHFIDGVLGPGTFTRLSPKAREMMMDNAGEMKAETMADDYFSPITGNDVSKIKCPMLFLKGEKSPGLFRLITDELHRFLPEAGIITIPESSHSMQVANPEFYNKNVIEFLLKNA